MNDRSVTAASRVAAICIVLGTAVVGSTAVPSPLVTSVLPSSRSVQTPGPPATIYATVINTGSTTASSVAIAFAGAIPASLAYQTTDSATNAPIGAPNAPSASRRARPRVS